MLLRECVWTQNGSYAITMIVVDGVEERSDDRLKIRQFISS